MGKSKSKDKDNTHGQNSIEAAADKAVGGIQALRDRAQEANKSPRETSETGPVRGQVSSESLTDHARDVAGVAAGAVGGTVNQANKGEVVEAEQTGGGAERQASRTAGEIVDRANQAIEAGKGPPKNGGQSAAEDARERAEATQQRLAELSGDVEEGVSKRAGDARDAARDAGQRAQEKGREASEKASRGAEEAKEEAKNGAKAVKEEVKNGAEAVKDGVARAGEKIAEKGREAKDTIKENAPKATGGQPEGLDRDGLERARQQARENTGSQLSKGLNKPADNTASNKAGTVRGKAESTANSAKAEAKGAADSIKSAYRDAKHSVTDKFHDAEDRARSALHGLRERLAELDADMHPDNLVDDSLSRGRIPSNTQDVLAFQGRK
jgi:hypothetical protein